MTVVVVQEIGKTQKGTPRAKINGEWYFLGRGIGAPPVGQSLEIKEGTFQFADGKDAKTIEAWRPAQAGSTPAPSQPNAAYIEEANLRFISNVVGSAIAAKTITEPGQVLAWFNAAKNALVGKSADIPFADDSRF